MQSHLSFFDTDSKVLTKSILQTVHAPYESSHFHVSDALQS
jgi:hypothetical protein